MSLERRTKERYRVWFPMTVSTEDGQEATGISFDVSASGLLMACVGALDVGTRVRLTFRIENDAGQPHVVSGTVRRVEPHADGPWRHRMAVEFDAPRPELEATLKTEADEPDPRG
ncbi:MAG: PilZ domain-containing protein [Sandaracinaceae bacterium]